MVRQVPCATNYYFRRFIQRGPAVGAPYLDAANYGRLRELAGRVTLRNESLEQAIAGLGPRYFSKMYASDVFEYGSAAECDAAIEQMAAALPPAGRLVWWELYLSREPSEQVQRSSRVRMLRAESAALSARDRNFFYRGFQILERLADEGDRGGGL